MPILDWLRTTAGPTSAALVGEDGYFDSDAAAIRSVR